MSGIKSKNLIKLNGTNVPGIQEQLNNQGDLMTWEGMSMISHITSNEGQQYIMKWCDTDDIVDRFLLLRTDDETLFKYFQKEITDLELLAQNPDGFVHFVELDDYILWKNTTQVAVENIPLEYLPKPHVFYKENVFEEYAHQLHARLREKFSKTEKRYPTSSLETEPLVVMEPPAKTYGKKKGEG